MRNVIHGLPVKNVDALANPDALEHFRDLPGAADLSGRVSGVTGGAATPAAAAAATLSQELAQRGFSPIRHSSPRWRASMTCATV